MNVENKTKSEVEKEIAFLRSKRRFDMTSDEVKRLRDLLWNSGRFKEAIEL